MSRIGIMGGTFNPIHQGHIILAQESYRQFRLDKVLVIPNKLPAYKDTDELLDSKQRSEMVQLAIKPYPYMEFRGIELERNGPTYTIDTLRELKQTSPQDTFFFILGGDSLVSLHKWRSYEAILRLTVILCAIREDAGRKELEAARDRLIARVPEAEIQFLDTDLLDISSTRIREEFYTNPDLVAWIPSEVRAFIQEHHLYTIREGEVHGDGAH